MIMRPHPLAPSPWLERGKFGNRFTVPLLYLRFVSPWAARLKGGRFRDCINRAVSAKRC